MTEKLPDTENTNQPPLVSVCIPVRNCESFIEEAIQSVLTGNFQDFEIVVVDNASTDQTIAVVSAIGDPRIRILRNETNVGACRNFNISMEEARGKYIKMLGADDILYKDCLAVQVPLLEEDKENAIAVVCCRRDVIDASGKVMLRGHGWPSKSKAVRLSGRSAIKQTVRTGRNLLGEPHTVLFRRIDALKLGGFDMELCKTTPFCIDWDLWCRLLQLGDLYVCEKTLVAYRVNVGSESLNLANQFADNDFRFIKSLQERSLASISDADIFIGRIRSKRDAMLRQGFYFLLGLSKLLPTR